MNSQIEKALNLTKQIDISLDELKKLNYTIQNSYDEFEYNVYNYDSIKSDLEKMSLNKKIQEEFEEKEKMKYQLEINVLVFLSILTIIGIICKN